MGKNWKNLGYFIFQYLVTLLIIEMNPVSENVSDVQKCLPGAMTFATVASARTAILVIRELVTRCLLDN